MKSNIKKILIIISGVLIFVIRLTGDIILLSINKEILLADGSLWNFTTSLLIISLATYYFYEESKADFNIKYDELIPFFSYSYFQSTFLVSSIFVIVLMSDSIGKLELSKGNYFNLIIKSFTYLYLILVSIISLGFSLKWIWSRRKKNTKEILFVLGITAIVLLLFNSVTYFFDTKGLILQKIASVIVLLFLMGIIFYIPIKTNWIATLSRKDKRKLFWLALISTITGIIVSTGSINQNSLLFADLNRFYSIASSYFTISMILYTVLSAKLLLSIAVTYPSSSLVEKKYQEVNNLAFLNKYVSESINKDDDFIISTVAELAFQTSLSNGGWVEIYKKNKTEIVKTFNIESSNLTKLDEMINISKNIKNYKNVFLIESIYESKDFINIASYNKFIKSLVIIPVYCFDNRIATITLFKNEEYKMEHDDVQVLSAFGDNIRMALENSNLMKESIEKEKYKNEMILAQKMQQKLLPQVLPIIENFSIAALSIPATVVGGDYYDTVFLKNGKLCIIIGDVSGKGISAAFYMAQLKGIVLAKSREVNTAKELLSGINEILYGTIESKMFITLAALVIDDIDGNLTLTRAGHMPFLIKNGENLDIITSSGIGVGLAKKSTFDRYLEEKPVKLNDKSAVIMFTDGINELNTYTNEEVGYKPLMELLTKNNVLDAQSYVSEMKSILNGYLEINANHDDMTVFALFFEKNNGTIIDNESLQNNYFITL